MPPNSTRRVRTWPRLFRFSLRSLLLLVLALCIVFAWLGPRLREPDQQRPAKKGFLGIDADDGNPGALVTDVLRGGPADDAGVQPGDVILSVDQVQLRDGKSLLETVAAMRPGKSVQLRIVRQGQPMRLSATLGVRSVLKFLTQTDPPRVEGGTIQVGNAGGITMSGWNGVGNLILGGGGLNVRGPFHQHWISVVEIRLRGRNAKTALSVSGDMTLAGLLCVRVTGFQPRLGDTFEIVRGSTSLQGEFDAFMMPPLGKNLRWLIKYDDVKAGRDFDGDGQHDVTLIVMDK